ncbi:unnamed protein product [Sympodiomycopsis kandeliae]
MASLPSPSSSSPSSSSAAGPAGLGQMSSLSPECTPLKHRYDTCFNSWFEEYLSLGTDSSASSSSSTATPSGSSFWGRSSSANSSNSTMLDSKEKRKQLRLELDGKCGEVLKSYQDCVKKALGQREILPLISEAREFNPFPFPIDSSSSSSSSSSGNSTPFPFPAATTQERQEWEKKNGW